MHDVPAQHHRPYTLVAELSYRCPLRCAYCSNPVQRYSPSAAELDTAAWQQTLTEAEGLGVLQVHFTGGEPLLRDDLEQLVAHAHQTGLYTSLITSAVGLTRARLADLAAQGLDHVQISIQGMSDADALKIAGRAGLAHKLEAMTWVRELGLPLTINVVLHRHNIDQIPELIALAERVGAERLELANTQYVGWALTNRDMLLPSSAQITRAREVTASARERLSTQAHPLELLFVLPDYHANIVRPCMQGWARQYIVISPDGLVLPCHQAHSLALPPALAFEHIGARSLAQIWANNPGLNAFRGEHWMREPCSSCERRTSDFGGCRCQAFQLTGDLYATDPACQLAPDHGLVAAARQRAEADPGEVVQLRYRRLPRDL